MTIWLMTWFNETHCQESIRISYNLKYNTHYLFCHEAIWPKCACFSTSCQPGAFYLQHSPWSCILSEGMSDYLCRTTRVTPASFFIVWPTNSFLSSSHSLANQSRVEPATMSWEFSKSGKTNRKINYSCKRYQTTCSGLSGLCESL